MSFVDVEIFITCSGNRDTTMIFTEFSASWLNKKTGWYFTNALVMTYVKHKRYVQVIGDILISQKLLCAHKVRSALELS